MSDPTVITGPTHDGLASCATERDVEIGRAMLRRQAEEMCGYRIAERDLPPGYALYEDAEPGRWVLARITPPRARITPVPATRESACQHAWDDVAIRGGKSCAAKPVMDLDESRE
jgi:hypothetical protein